MQKKTKYLQFALIFVPAMFFVLLWRSWIWLAVALISPARAVEYIKQEATCPTENNITNPFADFNIDNFKNIFTHEVAVPPRPQEEPLNPNYNVVQEFFASTENSLVLRKDNCYIKNVTYISDEEVDGVALSPVGFRAEKYSDQPQILIYHTHATESYLPQYDEPYDAEYSFRNTDTEKNMVAVGRRLADRLNRLGYNTIQDTTLHDYPSYNGSYNKSKQTVENYLAMYPSIKVVLDVHRDAAERDGAIISPVVDIEGQKCAQIMIISGADNGKLNMPNFWENLKFASRVQNTATNLYPGLMRPVLFDYRNYNQQLSTGAILVEIGTHGATLQQAKRSAELFGNALARALDNF